MIVEKSFGGSKLQRKNSRSMGGRFVLNGQSLCASMRVSLLHDVIIDVVTRMMTFS